MNYYISRSGQQYGPYSLADLQRYVQQGNIAMNDMARGDGMTDWVPVSQVLGNINTPPAAAPVTPTPTPYSAPQTPYNAPATPYGAPATPSSGASAAGYGAPATPGTYNPPSNPYGTPAASSGAPAGGYGAPATPGTYNPPSNPYGAPATPYAGQPNAPVPYAAPQTPYGGGQGAYGVPQQGGMYPAPPSLHWGIVLAISCFCSFFLWVWIFVQAAWVKKVRPQSNAMMLLIIAVCSIVGGIVIGFVLMAAGANQNEALAGIGVIIMGIGEIAYIVLFIMAIFSMRSAIEDFYNREEPIGLKLSGVMTFFFAPFYFQYHFTRIHEMKQQAAMQQRASAGGQYYGGQQ